jgi:hypothetical protein
MGSKREDNPSKRAGAMGWNPTLERTYGAVFKPCFGKLVFTRRGEGKAIDDVNTSGDGT